MRLHFNGHSEDDIREVFKFSAENGGAGLNYSVAMALHPDVSSTDRSHVQRVRFSCTGTTLSRQLTRDEGRLLSALGFAGRPVLRRDQSANQVSKPSCDVGSPPIRRSPTLDVISRKGNGSMHPRADEEMQLSLKRGIEKFARTVSKQPLGLAKFAPAPWGDIRLCFENARRKASESGGHPRYGWMFHESCISSSARGCMLPFPFRLMTSSVGLRLIGGLPTSQLKVWKLSSRIGRVVTQASLRNREPKQPPFIPGELTGKSSACAAKSHALHVRAIGRAHIGAKRHCGTIVEAGSAILRGKLKDLANVVLRVAVKIQHTRLGLCPVH